MRCDPVLAERAADQAGLVVDSEERTAFVRHYYQLRFLRFFGDAFDRWRLREMPHRVELLAGWRGAYYRPGECFSAGPYPGSLYAQDFPGGEPGFSNQFLGGVVVVDRDHETFPTRGYLAQGIAHAAGRRRAQLPLHLEPRFHRAHRRGNQPARALRAWHLHHRRQCVLTRSAASREHGQ